MNKVRAAVIVGVEELIEELGGNPDGIIEQAGLKQSDVDQPDKLVSARACFQVLNMAAEETGCAHFGLELANSRNLGTYLGILGDIARAAPTLGGALEDLVALMSIHTEISLWQLHQDNEVAYLTCSLINESKYSYVHAQQLCIGTGWRLIAELFGEHWRPAMATFTFSKPAKVLPYKLMFDATVEFDSDSGGLMFHAADLGQPLSSSNDGYHQKLTEKAYSIQKSRQLDIEDEVAKLIRKNLEMKVFGLKHVMKFLPYDRRTLQRKLRKRGTSYRALLEKLRVEMAQEMLSSSGMPLTMIAHRLGYADQSNFSNAFKENTGSSPRLWRRENTAVSLPS